MKINLFIFYFISISLFTSCKSIAQESNSKTEQLVASLSWESFVLDVTYGTQLNLGETAVELENMGKKTSNSLLKALNDSSKTVVVHMILTKIWEPEVFFLTTPICSVVDDDYSLYILNNLVWHKSNNDTSLWLLDEENKKVIINYWKARLK